MKIFGVCTTILLLLSHSAAISGAMDSRDSVLHGKIICIDPGHGGTAQTDQYRISRSGQREEWIDLRVAKELKELLTAAGATVLMTRETDTAIALADRATLAVNGHADLFLSIHHNATADTSVNFPIVYFHGNASENAAGVELGKCVLRSLVAALYKGRTDASLVSDLAIFPGSGAAVLRRSYGIAGVIAEASFFTNAGEDARLRDSAYTEREATAFVDALALFFSKPVPEIKPKNSVVSIRPFPVYQEAQRMSDSAKAWHTMYVKGKEKFKEGTPASLREAYRLFSASAQGFPDSYVARECHVFLSRITETDDKSFSAEEVKRANEHYVPFDVNHRE